MDPGIFLLAEDTGDLVNTLVDLVNRLGANGLMNALKLTGMDVRELPSSDNPVTYAEGVVEAWNEWEVSDERPGYHPLVAVVGYLLKVHQFKKKQRDFLQMLLDRGNDNLKALEFCKAVGLIEYPYGTVCGTAVLFGSQRILTCSHVIAPLKGAAMRFGYYYSGGQINNEDYFSMDLSKVTFSRQDLDFAIVAFEGQLGYEFTKFNLQKPKTGQNVRMIHPLEGKSLAISNTGTILSVEDGLLSHTITNVQRGSSGAPIFNADWEVIALHRGPASGITLNAIHYEIDTFFPSNERMQKQDHLHANAASTMERQTFIEQVERLQREREVPRLSDKPKQTPVTIELDFLEYGLDTEIGNFQHALIPAQGAFAFEIHGDSELIEKYVIEKMLRALQQKIGGRIYSKKEINLYAEDIEKNIGEGGTPRGLEVIERRIKVEKRVDKIGEFLTDIPKSQDIVFIIWCKTPLSQRMKSIAQSFWTSVGTEDWKEPIVRGRRFVVIWVTPDTREQESIGKPFTAIPLPEKLDLADLSNWFWGQLQKHIDKEEIEEKKVQEYISSLEGHYGYLKETYTRLEEIAQELANGSHGKG